MKILKILLGKLLPPKDSPFTRGYNWAKHEIEYLGRPRTYIEAYLNNDEFDKGASAYLRDSMKNTIL